MTKPLTRRHIDAAIMTVAIKTALGQVFQKIGVWAFVCLLIFTCISLSVNWLKGNFDRDSTDGVERSGMKIHIDAQTGCQYLSVKGGGVTPRINPNGQPICKKGK